MVLIFTGGPRKYDYDKTTEGYENALADFHFNNWVRIVTMIIAPVGLVGNSIVLWLLGFRIQRNPFSVYILNLAAYLCGAFLFCLDRLFNFVYFFVAFMVFFSLTHLFYTVGLSLLAAISTERCLSVLFPIWYRCHRPKHTSAVVCALLWALGGLLWLIYASSRDVFGYSSLSYYLGDIILSISFILLTCVLCVSSLTLLLRVKCSSQRRQPPRLYLLVLLTVLVFLLCGLAPGISIVLRLFHIRFIPFWISWLLACVNSSANPFIYFFLGSQRHKRKEPLRVLLQKALADDQEMVRESGDIPCTQTLETSS